MLSGSREDVDLLSGTVDAVTTSITVTDGISQAIQRGALLELENEVCYVRSYDSASKTALVIRGFDGSTAVPHTGCVVTVNPRWPRYRIFQALNDTLLDINSPQFFAMRTADLTFSSSQFVYDLGDSSADEVYSVTFAINPSSPTLWQVMDQGFDLIQNLSTAQFPSGVAVQFDSPPAVQSGQTFRVRYKTAFTLLADLVTDVSATGIPQSATDIPPLGAALRLLDGKPVKRSQTEAQGPTRRPSEVPAGAIESSARLLASRFQARLASEERALTLKYPIRKKQYGITQRRMMTAGY